MRTHHVPRALLVAAAAWALAGGCGGGESTTPTDGGSPDTSDTNRPPDAPVGLTVTAVAPGQGPLAGGTTVVVSGSGFVDGLSVSFGEKAGIDQVLLSDYQVKVTTPPSSNPGKVTVSVRLPDGTSAGLPGGFEYRVPEPTGVDWCVLHWPASTVTQPSVPSEPIFGQAWEEGCTDGESECQSLQAELGYGDPAVDPSTSPASYTWVSAAYNPGHTGDDNDEHMATLTIAQEGTYAFLYRYSVDAGSTWVYCDLSGSGDGFQPDQLGHLEVATTARSVAWCGLQFPAETTATPGSASESIYGQVYVPGCTEGTAVCSDLRAELGHGAPGVDPSASPGGFTWVAATYNDAHTTDDNDEYGASITEDVAGTYGYAFRFSVDDGATWRYCDLDGNGNGFAVPQMGRLTVGAPQVDWCVLQYPEATTTAPGASTEPIYGRAYVAGCTDGAAQCPGITAEVGYGDLAADPSASPGSFTWVAAGYNPSHTTNDDDEYAAALTVAGNGTYGYAYRFSLDGGTTWRYCDRDGSGNGFQVDQMGYLSVEALSVAWCQLQYPSATTTVAAVASEPIYGQVLVVGCTSSPERCVAVTAQVGYGDPGTDPSSAPGSYTWVPAVYNDAHTGDSNDEYMVALTPATDGTYGYVYRFSTDAGATWTYCDLDFGDGLQTGQLGSLTVSDKSIDWCNVQSPASVSVTAGTSTGAIYGQVLSSGCSEGTAWCGGILAELGFGAAGVDPSVTPGSYSWVPAAYNAAHTGDNNDEYSAALVPGTPGTYGYVYRFSGDAGETWHYCDTTGGDFSVADVGVLTVN